tara:strand:+ start:3869 stop:5359 length:1491 start_codon:yes stop_codon:yes gene_type:complete
VVIKSNSTGSEAALDKLLCNNRVNLSAWCEGNIGVYGVTLGLGKVRKDGNYTIPYVSVQSSHYHKASKQFYLSTHGWPQALFKAVDYAVEQYDAHFPGQLEPEQLNWVKAWARLTDVEHLITGLMWKKIANSTLPVMVNSPQVLCEEVRFISVKPCSEGMGVFYRADNQRRRIVRSVAELYSWLPYIAASVAHERFQESEKEEYGLAVYYSLITSFVGILEENGISDTPPYSMTKERFMRMFNAFFDGFKGLRTLPDMPSPSERLLRANEEREPEPYLVFGEDGKPVRLPHVKFWWGKTKNSYLPYVIAGTKTFSLSRHGWPKSFELAVKTVADAVHIETPDRLSADEKRWLEGWVQSEEGEQWAANQLWEKCPNPKLASLNSEFMLSGLPRWVRVGHKDDATYIVFGRTGGKKQVRVHSLKEFVAWLSYAAAWNAQRYVSQNHHREYALACYFAYATYYRDVCPITFEDKNSYVIGLNTFMRYFEGWLPQAKVEG